MELCSNRFVARMEPASTGMPPKTDGRSQRGDFTLGFADQFQGVPHVRLSVGRSAEVVLGVSLGRELGPVKVMKLKSLSQAFLDVRCQHRRGCGQGPL